MYVVNPVSALFRRLSNIFVRKPGSQGQSGRHSERIGAYLLHFGFVQRGFCPGVDAKIWGLMMFAPPRSRRP
jgi:hypothetical protein